MIRSLFYISLFFFMNYQFAFCQGEKEAIDFDESDQDFSQTITRASENGFVVVPPHPAAHVTLMPSKKFMVTANGLPVPVRNASVTSDAWFFFSGVVDIKVSFHEPVNTYEISPKSLPAEINVEDNTITVKLDSPRKFIIYDVNGENESLSVFADSPPENIPDTTLISTINVTSYITKDKLKKISSAISHDQLIELDISPEIQKAINGLPKNATLFFPSGLYPISAIKLKSEMEIYFSPGSILYSICGTRELKGRDTPMFDARDVMNTKIRGHGTIMANGQIYNNGGDGRIRRQVAMRMSGTNLVFSDFLIREQQHWPWLLGGSENVLIRNIKILTSLDGENRDGIGVSTAKNILIEDNFVCSGDDALVVKVKRGTEDFDYRLVARNNVFWNMRSGGGIKIGTQFWSPEVKNLAFENIDIISAPRSLSFYFEDKGMNVRDVVYKNIRCERTHARPGAKALMMDLKMGSIFNVRFINLHIMHNSPFDLMPGEEVDALFNGFYRYLNGISQPPLKVLAPETGMPSEGIKFADEPCTVIGIKSMMPAVSSKGKYKVFKIYRTGDLSTSVTIPYSVRSNAVQDKHYRALNGSVKLEAGVDEAVISIEFFNKAFEGEHKSLLISPDYIPDDYVMMGPDYHACVAILAKH